MASIHQTAIVSPTAKLGNNVQIGAYCVVGDEVELGDGCVLKSHVVLEGPCQIGKHNQFFPYSVTGVVPQDLKYQGERTLVEMGDHNIVREYSSIHRGTSHGGGKTSIGSHNLIMAYVHVAHDCKIGNHNILANSVQLSGHVVLDDRTVIGGQTGAVQFIRVGSYAFIGAGTMIDQNVPPYATGYGNRINLKGVNVIGLQRNGFEQADIATISTMHKDFLKSTGNWQEVVTNLKSKYAHCPATLTYLRFIQEVEGKVKRKP